MSDIADRKSSHIELCANEDVESRRGTLLDQVQLLHDSLPELSAADVDLSTELVGRQLLAPIVITGMTGGTDEAGEINRSLATAAQKFGLGMGVGSQRPMLLDEAAAASYRVREVAPDILLLANLGAVQARDAGTFAVGRLASEIGADAVCIHLNPAQELVQDEGDRDFRGCLQAIAELARELPIPVIAKETGCGLSEHTLSRLRAAGVQTVDVSGAGGTTWTGVEGLRGSPRQQALGRELREWGIPTAASVIYARRAGMTTIASGGLRGGLDVARALALGARAAGLALPFLRAHAEGGLPAVLTATERLIEALRAICVLTGCPRAADLAHARRVLGPELRAWVD